MALNFPSSPVEGDTYNDGIVTYIFTGTKWKQEVTNYNYSGYTPSSANNTTEIDLSQGNFFNVELSEKTNISFVNPPDASYSQKFYLKLSTPSDYNAETNYDIEDMTYDNVSYLAFPQTPAPTSGSNAASGIYIKPDGTKMYLMGSDSSGSSGSQQNEYVYQYTLSTPWDLSSASYDNVFTNTFVEIGYWGNNSLQFSLDGTKFFICLQLGETIRQFNMTTSWDISTASYSNISFNAFNATETYNHHKFFFRNDGLKLYTVSYNSDSIYEYDLSSAWDMTTISYTGKTFNIGSQDGIPWGFAFRDDGKRIYVTGMTNDKIFEYSVSEPWDISTASYNGISFDFTNETANSLGLFIKPNGGKLYLGGQTDQKVYQYDISGFTTTPELSWEDNIIWNTNFPPTLPELSQTDLLEFYTSDGGTTYYAKLSEDNIS